MYGINEEENVLRAWSQDRPRLFETSSFQARLYEKALDSETLRVWL